MPNIKTRIINKHDTEANWALAENFKPLAGEVIVYDVDSNHAYPRFKVGDGKTSVSALPFSIDILTNYVTETELASALNATTSAINKNIATIDDEVATHIAAVNNPHQVNKAQVGLGNVDNTSDINKPVSTAQAAAIKQEADAREAEDNNIKAELNNKYTKPSSGIPKTDLAESVQQSITKADTALQYIPIASPFTLGGVKPVVATDEMTQPVGINTSGELFTEPAPDLPTPTTSVNGKFLMVSNSNYALADVFSELANPNILINSNFKINQRGASSYDSDNYGYTVDRWRMEGGSVWTLCSVTPVSNGLKINNGQGVTITVDQPIEEGLIVRGETYTLSATVDGVAKSISFAVNSTTRTLIFTYATVTLSTDYRSGADYKVSLNVYGNKTVTFNNVKLEKGAQATAYTEPDPAIELLKCQRFYHARRYEVPIIYSPSSKGNYGGGQVNFPVTMRVAPTITITGASISGNSSPLDDTYYNSVDQNGFFAYTGNSYNRYMRFAIRYTADAEI